MFFFFLNVLVYNIPIQLCAHKNSSIYCSLVLYLSKSFFLFTAVSSLNQLSAHIHKLLPHASALMFNDGLGLPSVEHTPSHVQPLRASRHKISGIVSTAGERLDLTQVL